MYTKKEKRRNDKMEAMKSGNLLDSMTEIPCMTPLMVNIVTQNKKKSSKEKKILVYLEIVKTWPKQAVQPPSR